MANTRVCPPHRQWSLRHGGAWFFVSLFNQALLYFQHTMMLTLQKNWRSSFLAMSAALVLQFAWGSAQAQTTLRVTTIPEEAATE